MLSAFQKYFDSIVIPQITNNDKWGALDENEQGIVFWWFRGKRILYLFFKDSGQNIDLNELEKSFDLVIVR